MHFTLQTFIRQDQWRHRRTKVSFKTIFKDQWLKVLADKLTIFSNQLSKRLSKTKEFKLKKLLKKIPVYSSDWNIRPHSNWLGNNMKQPRSTWWYYSSSYKLYPETVSYTCHSISISLLCIWLWIVSLRNNSNNP